MHLGPGAGGSDDEGTGGTKGEGSGGEQNPTGGRTRDDTGGTGMGGEEPASGGSAPSGGTSSGGDNAGSGGDGSGGETTNTGGETGAGGDQGTGGEPGTGGAPNVECTPDDPLCVVLAETLVHRYSFDGTGTELTDTVGGAHGFVRRTSLNGDGKLILDGENDYVDLPAGLLSSLANASLEVWFVWEGAAEWQKLFEFGDSNLLNNPDNYLYVTTRGGGSIPEQRALAAGLRHPGSQDRQLRTTEITTTGVLTQVVLGVDDTNNRLTLYKNGQYIVEDNIDVRLDDLQDDTNRLGSSLFLDDPYFQGVITEFRIYDAVLSPAAVAKSYALGEDAVYENGN